MTSPAANSQPDNTTKATYGLMVAGMAKDIGLTLPETLKLIRMAWGIASGIPGKPTTP